MGIPEIAICITLSLAWLYKNNKQAHDMQEEDK